MNRSAFRHVRWGGTVVEVPVGATVAAVATEITDPLK